jgi:Holliday junction resolvasome RuvABC endonuclease subunit
MKIYLPNVDKGIYIGLDLASKSGWAVVKSDKKGVCLIDYGMISLPQGMDEVNKLGYIEKLFIPIFDKYLKNAKLNTLAIIEDCFLKQNPKTLIKLARLEGFILNTVSKYSNAYIVYPSHARKLINFRQKGKKELVVAYVNKLLRKNLFTLEHHDITDAIVLALAGGRL